MAGSSEFVSEAQDIIESFSRQLLDIEQQLRDSGDFDPDLLNGAFRAVHTLKGLSALTGGAGIADLSHGLENTHEMVKIIETDF